MTIDAGTAGRKEPKVGPAGIAGWLLFDWASQPFWTLITTFVFAPYFAAAVAPTPELGQAWWGYATGFAGLFIAFMSPILGSIADATGPRKPWIILFSLMLVAGSSTLWIAAPGATDTVIWVLVAFAIATIGAEFGIVFTNAMMPDLVDEDRLGRLSGNGWAIGYVGGLVALIAVLGLMSASPETGKTLPGLDPIFGLDAEAREGDRISGPFSALWYVIFVIPLFLFTPDTPRKRSIASAVGHGFSDLKATLISLFDHSNVLVFLIARMFYQDALVALFAFGGIYAAGVLGWSIIEVGIFGILLSITGTFGSWIGGLLDDRLGPKTVVSWSLGLLLLCCIGVVSTSRDQIFFLIDVAPRAAGDPMFSAAPDIVYLILGGLIGAGAGPMQAASRTLLVKLAPRDRMTQYFGLYALTGKVTSFVGPLSVGIVTQLSNSQRIGIIPMIALFGIGLVLLTRVRVERATEAGNGRS